jgi:hypothetical protein
MALRRVKVDMPELAAAFDAGLMEASHFLDLETGNVVLVTDEDSGVVDEFLGEADVKDDEDPKAEFEEWLKEYACPDWQRDSIRDAYLVETEFGERFIRVPAQDSRDGYTDMVAFAETVKDQHLRKLLLVALNGKGAFRRFRDVLTGDPDDRERWFRFSEQKVTERVLEWLESKEIEVEQPDGDSRA